MQEQTVQEANSLSSPDLIQANFNIESTMKLSNSSTLLSQLDLECDEEIERIDSEERKSSMKNINNNNEPIFEVPQTPIKIEMKNEDKVTNDMKAESSNNTTRKRRRGHVLK